MYKYYKPQDVISPKDCIDAVIPLFDGGVDGAYSIAKITWKGQECIGLRWNINERERYDNEKETGTEICIGEPNSRCFPTWFILPDDFIKEMLTGQGEIADKIKEILENLEK